MSNAVPQIKAGQEAIKAAVDDLDALMGNLNESDRKFAESLIHGTYGFKKRGFLTDKQAPHVLRLLELAIGGTDHRGTTLEVKGITTLFELAKQKIKFPKIKMKTEFGMVQIWIQGQKAKYPGAIGILVDGQWFGRIHTDGTFQAGGNYANSGFKDEFLDLLTSFSADPSGIAAKYGKLAGSCCFCHKPLSDEKSLAVGYGLTCAKNYGLIWGLAKVSLATLTGEVQ